MLYLVFLQNMNTRIVCCIMSTANQIDCDPQGRIISGYLHETAEVRPDEGGGRMRDE